MSVPILLIDNLKVKCAIFEDSKLRSRVKAPPPTGLATHTHHLDTLCTSSSLFLSSHPDYEALRQLGCIVLFWPPTVMMNFYPCVYGFHQCILSGPKLNIKHGQIIVRTT